MKTAKVTRILHSQGLHKAKFDRLTRIAALCGPRARRRVATLQRPVHGATVRVRDPQRLDGGGL